MSLKNVHPDYSGMLDDWRQMRDTLAGQRTVKHAEDLYLSPTQSMILDGALKRQEPGYSAYQAYIRRAVFPDLTNLAAHTMVGLIMKDPSEYILPDGMLGLLDSATKEGETLEALHRRILWNQLGYGRLGLAIDFSEDRSLPYFVPYTAEQISNWDTITTPGSVNNLSLIVTKENVRVRGDEAAGTQYEWTNTDRYRAMEFGPNGQYQTYTEIDGTAGDVVVPTFNGNPLDFIPFTIIGAQDLVTTPGPIPLLSVSNAALSIYCGEADFRQTLHMMGQDTLVIIGVTSGEEGDDEGPTRVGANAIIELPIEGDAKYIGITGEGLNEQRLALEDDYKRASSEGSRLLENNAAQAESGEALKVRVVAKTTTLTTVAVVGAFGLESALKQMAVAMNLDPDEVRVEPNTDFVQDKLPPQEVASMMEAKQNGVPLSYETIHKYLRDNEYTSLTFEEELQRIAQEASAVTGTINAGRVIDGTTPTGSNDATN